MTKVHLVIKTCTHCQPSRKHQIWTPDSFEHVSGIYCDKVNDATDSWERRTYDGRIEKKLIASDDWDVDKYAYIPDWCPLLPAAKS